MTTATDDMNATVTRQFEPPDSECSGQSGIAVLEHGGYRYELSYSIHTGLSVLRTGDFPSKYRAGWCGINYDHEDRLKPGYYDVDVRWVDVELTESDRIVRRWAEANCRSLFGIGIKSDRDKTPYHKPDF